MSDNRRYHGREVLRAEMWPLTYFLPGEIGALLVEWLDDGSVWLGLPEPTCERGYLRLPPALLKRLNETVP